MAVASKDNSISEFDFLNINNSSTCLSAYNKKQEFSGGFISVNKLVCKNYKIKYSSDIRSKIIINK